MTIEDQIELLKKYLLMKFEQEDWHGVMDAAADLRELVIKVQERCATLKSSNATKSASAAAASSKKAI